MPTSFMIDTLCYEKLRKTDPERNGPTSRAHKQQLRNIFNDANYESNDGFSTLIWGPSAWHFLHIMSFNYVPALDRNNYYNFMYSIGDVLPCGICREHYVDNLKVADFGPHSLGDRDSFTHFMYNLHEIVNKKSLPVTYEQMLRNYEMFRYRFGPDCRLQSRYPYRISVRIGPEQLLRNVPSFSLPENIGL